jgi:hypothetical protein
MPSVTALHQLAQTQQVLSQLTVCRQGGRPASVVTTTLLATTLTIFVCCCSTARSPVQEACRFLHSCDLPLLSQFQVHYRGASAAAPYSSNVQALAFGIVTSRFCSTLTLEGVKNKIGFRFPDREFQAGVEISPPPTTISCEPYFPVLYQLSGLSPFGFFGNRYRSDVPEGTGQIYRTEQNRSVGQSVSQSVTSNFTIRTPLVPTVVPSPQNLTRPDRSQILHP